MHLCDNPPCYRYDHLRIGTVAENNADRDTKNRGGAGWENPFWLHKRGQEHSQAKLTKDQVHLIRHRLAQGEKGYVLAAEFGVSKATVSLIKNRKLWTDL